MKKKIIILHQNMVFGGVEKVTLNILKNIDQTKFDIRLILVEKYGELEGDIPENIIIKYLLNRSISKNKNKVLKIISYIKELIIIRKKMKKLINKEDILLVMNIRNFRLNFSLKKYRNKKIGWFHSTIDSDTNNFLTKLNYKLFTQYNIIYNVSKEGKKIFDKKLPDLKLISKVLYNSFDIKRIKILSEEKLTKSENYILTVGRLVNNHKGFDKLIEVMRMLKNEGIEKKLIIIGEGSDRNILEKKIQEYSLENNVYLKGFDLNPYKWIKNAEIFILSSNYEGLPTVLIEALICQTPIVSTNCNCGPAEILKDGEYGVLTEVGNILQLKEGIKTLILDENLRVKLRRKSLERAKEFSNEKQIKKLENDILEL